MIINALVIAVGFTPYWVEKINAINPTGADATMMVVSANEKSILSKLHIMKINKISYYIFYQIVKNFLLILFIFLSIAWLLQITRLFTITNFIQFN